MNKFKKILVLIPLLSLIILSQTYAGPFTVFSGDSVYRDFKFQSEPGKQINTSVSITNKSENEDLYAVLYPTDGYQNNNGGISFTQKTDTQKTIGLWTKLSKDQIVVPPNQTVNIPLTINIPKDVLAGDYFGGIAVETKNGSPGEEGTSTGGTGSKVVTTTRIVKTLKINIPGEINHSFNLLAFQNKQVNRDLIEFSIDALNDGNTNLVLAGTIDIFDHTGTKVHGITINNTNLLKGSTSLKQTWANPPYVGNFKAVLNLEVKYENLLTRSFQTIRVVTKESSFYILPIELVIAPLAIIILVFLTWLILFLRKRNLIKHSIKYIVQENDTLEKLATDNQTSWKVIAKLNKLAPPYNLEVGKEILIPKKS